MASQSGMGVLLVVLLLPATALAAGVEIVGTTGSPGATTRVTVKLKADSGESVVGAQNDLTFDRSLVSVPFVAENANKPACRVDPSIEKLINVGTEENPDLRDDFGFGFLKDGVACDPTQDQCDSIRAIIVSTENLNTIPAGANLYSCDFAVAGSVAPGTTIALTIPPSSVIGSDGAGTRLASFTGDGGAIVVSGGGCPGDCSGSANQVDLLDLQTGLDIFFGDQSNDVCPNFSSDGTAGVSLIDLQNALDKFFDGCG